ncbi:hypothetical protein [Lactiplantibacillus plantarum]|uniref:hypothetical protein n=1 Tax=Lactiplantibacillus plantarum TaxID=1590 RepID=UPI001EDA2F4C|nr:hypothetical protein [Lactiplantibacillus plantarum]
MTSGVLKITKVSTEDKAKLKLLSQIGGYASVSDFMRMIITKVVAQNNLDFLIYGDVTNQLIAQNELLNRIVESNNLSTAELELVKKLLQRLLGED